MANDYFQDITPPHEPNRHRPVHHHQEEARETASEEETNSEEEATEVPIRIEGAGSPPRGIRSIPPSRTIRLRPGAAGRGPVPMPGILGGARRAPGRFSRVWMWGAAALALIVLAGLGLFIFRATTVTVTPRSHVITLTPATTFTAYPAATAASGALTYELKTADLEDSVVVPVSGTTTSVASKATGSVTVYNSYSTSPVHLIKTTRFETPDGRIFRVPADVTVPGMKGTTPGTVKVTIVADATGDQYNVGPSKWTLPGLKSNAPMYAGVYAKSTAPMTGGSSGVSGPGVDPAALSAAVTKLQDNLLSKARDTAAAQTGTDETVLSDLIQITYATQPNTAEAGGGARVHETAHVQIPVFKTLQLGQTVGSAVAADADNSLITLIPGNGFAASLASTQYDLASGPLEFTLSGTANLVWSVDTAALASALAGRDQGAFQTVISGFSGIQEAHAKIEPFWKSTFPANADSIKIIVTAPASAK